MGEHAEFAPSAAERIIECPASFQFAKVFTNTNSEYAEEGSTAHELAEVLLNQALKRGDLVKQIKTLERIQGGTNPYYTDEMLRIVKGYVSRVLEDYAAALKQSEGKAEIFIETKVDISHIIPNCFGTIDTCIVWPGNIIIRDLKYGRGVPVEAEANSQQMMYALGALKHLYKYSPNVAGYPVLVQIVIDQPRLRIIDRWDTDSSFILSWAQKTLIPAASQAIDGMGDFKAGDHCRFCPAILTCRVHSEYCLEVVKEEMKDPEIIGPLEISRILLRAQNIESWLKSLKDWAISEALKGKIFPSLKLVKGRGKRMYKDEDAIRSTLVDDLMMDESEIGGFKLKGITDLENILGAKNFNTFVSPYVIKPDGAPTLVPATDKRPAIGSAESAIEDFSGFDPESL